MLVYLILYTYSSYICFASSLFIFIFSRLFKHFFSIFILLFYIAGSLFYLHDSSGLYFPTILLQTDMHLLFFILFFFNFLFLSVIWRKNYHNVRETSVIPSSGQKLSNDIVSRTHSNFPLQQEIFV